MGWGGNDGSNEVLWGVGWVGGGEEKKVGMRCCAGLGGWVGTYVGV